MCDVNNIGSATASCGIPNHKPGSGEDWKLEIHNKGGRITIYWNGKKVDLEKDRALVNGRAVCIDSAATLTNMGGFTVGKIYTFADGRCRDDDGDIRPLLFAPALTETDERFKNQFVLLRE